MKVKRGEYKIIRADGTEEIISQRPTLSAVHKAIGCDCCDTVILTRGSDEPIVMMVDDTGMIDGKPVNPKATELYHSVSRPGNPYSIHGDVVIVNDGDFE